MTPDRTEHTPDEPQNGVLSDTGSLDTTGLGILGGATAQVNVELPTEADDDRDDDGVIDDEVPFVVEIPADADLPVAAVEDDAFDAPAEHETVAELEEWTVEAEEDAAAPEAEPEAAAEDIVDAEEVVDLEEILEIDENTEGPLDVETPAEADADVAELPADADDQVAVDEPEAAEIPVADVEAEASVESEPADVAAPAVEVVSVADDFTGADFDETDFEDDDFGAEFDPAEFDIVLDEAAAEAALAQAAVTGDDVIATDDTAEEPMSAKTPADDADKGDATSTPGGAKAASAPAPPSVSAAAAAKAAAAPATRREAQHTGAQPVVERAVERSFPRGEVSLTSKRLGEFENDRETADLLTADRLLDPHQVVRPEPEGAWQQFVYSISGRRINLGDSKRAKARKELDRRIAAPLAGGARFVPVLSRKGGVGKTTVTTLLGMALADARDDRVIAVDANPDRGTLAERISRESGKTVRDLVRVSGDVVGFNDLSNIVARDETRLDVVASDTDPRVSEAFNDVDYRDVASLAAHYYSVVLTDTGTGIVHSVMGATLDLADQLVIVAGLSVDEARLASETLTWLETNGYADKVRGAVVVLNNARPGHPLVQLDELEAHFRTRVRAVVRMPYDPHIAAGSAIAFRELQPATRDAARELAATVVEGLRSLAPAA